MKKLLVCVLAIALLLTFCACGNKADEGEERTAKKEKSAHLLPLDIYMEVMTQAKYNKIRDMAPKTYWDYLAEKGLPYDTLVGQMKEQRVLENYMETNQGYFGDDLKISYKVLSTEDMDSSKLQEAAEALESAYGISAKDVEAGKVLMVEFSMKGAEAEDISEREVQVVMIDGVWYWISWYEMDGQQYVDFTLFQ